ncbi:hypothetical protein Ga0123462_0418 [Mariprofundus ferrinatatus]|uniref:AAA+ ATPase domain-containing protein n=1 Tax=Mariprofundus ferrinatatus TaxID=1921087 RepID=A0A2K8L221_9PROT|nr:helicase HerA-like domain-containing protein [Mariprofundus ferrinatatus]ATX81293.1 hypothetical protein Ga0123462_0418 [Mariprofundus ferrinatatus]
MSEAPQLLIGGACGQQVKLDAGMANRHGLIAGATGTGKTVTLQSLAEGFSRIGVPVFMADIKGDLSGISQAGKPHKEVDRRIREIAIDGYSQRGNPVLFWDIFGRSGHPVRTTISDMGPLLLSNLLDLNDTQSGLLYAAFRIADDQGLLLLDLKDLRSMLSWMSENAKELKSDYGNISSASIGSIQRGLLVLEEQGAEHFFGEPALRLSDLMITDFSGFGVISLLDVTELIAKSPKLYATFLLWLLAELYENLPEVGDADRPKMVLFFDEAHLLFDGAPDVLLDKVEQVVRLIRSKGVGVYFVTQSPLDIPESVLGQLGMRIQHALRAFTPKDKKAVKTIAGTFRTNPELDTEAVISQLGTGEALVSTLDATGAPTQVERILIAPPQSRIGPASIDERSAMISRSPLAGRYEEMIDRESAHELLKARAEDEARRESAAKAEQQQIWQEPAAPKRPAGRPRDSMGEAIMKSAARSVSSAIGGAIGRKLVRGLLGSLLGGR